MSDSFHHARRTTQPFRGPQGLTRSVNGRDFDRFAAEGTDGLLGTAYLIVGDLQEGRGLGQPHGLSGRLCAPDPGQPRAARQPQALTPPDRTERDAPADTTAPALRSNATTSSTPHSRRCRRASARCSSCVTSWTFPKPRLLPHCSAPSARSRARLLVHSRDSSRRCARPTKGAPSGGRAAASTGYTGSFRRPPLAGRLREGERPAHGQPDHRG